MIHPKIQESIAETQAEVFLMSLEKDLDSPTFIKAFMRSNAAKHLDSEFDFLQWAGRAYILDAFLDEAKDQLKIGGELYDKETMYWIGYTYRMWHFHTNESSKEIYKQAPAKTMRIVYLPYHTMSVEMAVDRLKETYQAKHHK